MKNVNIRKKFFKKPKKRGRVPQEAS